MPETGLLSAHAQPQRRKDLFGYNIRNSLHLGEYQFFKSNPHVSGMASEAGDIILNPFSGQGVNYNAVAKNEAFRLLLRDKGVVPEFELTPEQKKAFAGTAYANDENALRGTIAARIYSGDPSARATSQQQDWLAKFLGGLGE